jgi:DNA-binding response OmpR family regulator
VSQTILIIDDDADVVRFLTRRLSLAGFEVLSAGDGILGEDVARRERPDLILLDMRMPRRDGLATLVALRGCSDLSLTPVVMLSGVGDEGNTALNKGASDVLLKPCRNEDLLRTIRRCLPQPQDRVTANTA